MRDILLTEAIATLVAGLCGGVAQTTPYIGQPAFRAMGARSGYTFLAGVFIGLGGVFGYLSNLVELIPLCVLAPILIYIAIHITMQAFEATPQNYFAAVVLAFFPAIARMLAIKLGDPSVVAPDVFAQLYAHADHGLPVTAVIFILGNGFIITSMVWASFVVALIDQRPRKAAVILAAGAALTFFGIIHSVDPIGTIYLPWTLAAGARALVWQFTAAYLVLAALLLLLSLLRQEPSQKKT